MKQEIINLIKCYLENKGYKMRSIYIEEIIGEFGHYSGKEFLDIKSQLVIRAKK